MSTAPVTTTTGARATGVSTGVTTGARATTGAHPAAMMGPDMTQASTTTEASWPS